MLQVCGSARAGGKVGVRLPEQVRLGWLHEVSVLRVERAGRVTQREQHGKQTAGMWPTAEAFVRARGDAEQEVVRLATSSNEN